MTTHKPLSDQDLAQFVNEGYLVARGLLDLELGQQHPESELHDAQQWGQMWHQARQNIVQNGIPTFTRWDGNAIGCA